MIKKLLPAWVTDTSCPPSTSRTFPIHESRKETFQHLSIRSVKKLVLAMALLIVGFASQAQDPAQYGTPFSGVPNRMDANIYQLNLREYSATRNIAGARAKLQRIKDLGINVIYLMPIYPLGVENNPDGSPYSHKDLKSVAPDLGTLADLRGLVADAHNLGMSVILDFVANQTAWDHPWVTQHPDWYVRDSGGNILPPCPAPDFCFNDVAHFDLDNSSAAAAMVDALRYWVFAANVDGYRFDWADKAPASFWSNTISNLRGISSHDLLLLAEGSNEGTNSGCTTCGLNQPGAHYASGFDYIFGTNFYWNVMKKIWNSGEPANNLTGVTTGEYTGASSTQLVARFLSNHDDYNADGSPFSFLSGGRNAAMSAFVVASYHRGVPFIYNGIEVGNTNPLPYPWNSGTINWSQDLSVYTEMQKILNFRNSSVALRRGQPTSYIDPANTNPDVIAFTKTSGSEKVAVLVNVRNSTKSFTIPSGMAGTYKDAYSGTTVNLTTGSSQSLAPYQYLVLTNASVPVVAVTGVSVSPTSPSIKAGFQTQLSVSVAPSNATNQNVTWSSSNTSVATVSASGLVTGVSQGSANITVTTQDGNKTAVAAITVTPSTNFTVHFYRPASWGTNVNIYWWSAVPTGVLADASWPGAAMTSEGGDWYSYTFTNVTTTNLIFNDGTTQSDDLTRGSTGWYQNETWHNSNPGASNSLTLSTASQSYAAGASSQTVNVSANVSWTVTDNQSWISTSPSSGSNNGSFAVNVTANGGVARTGAVTVTGGGITRAIAVSQSGVSAQAPFGGSARAIPGTIQLENYDTGGEGVAYHDVDAGNSGNQYRTTEGVDVEVCSEGGYNLGWTAAGEWVEYTVNVATAGNYDVSVRAAGGNGGTLKVLFGGVDKTGTITVPNTGGWQNWQTVTKTGVALSAGTQVMQIYMNTDGFNLNSVTLTSVASCTPTAITAYTQVNGGTWQQGVTAATVTVGGSVTFGPQPSSGGTWSWAGPNGYTANVREIALSNLQSNQSGNYVATYTNAGGCVSSKTFGVTVNPVSGGTGFYIKNRWQGTYLYDAGSNVGYGSFSSAANYQWELISVDGYTAIQNVGTGDLMHIENLTGSVQCSIAESSYWSAQWAVEDYDGHKRIQNRWQGGNYVHIENLTGSAQYGSIYAGSFSNHWTFESASGARIAETEEVDVAAIATATQIYPNPVQDMLNINFSSMEDEDVMIRIVDATGRVLYHDQIHTDKNQRINKAINLSNYRSGLYVVSIEQAGNLTYHRIVKK